MFTVNVWTAGHRLESLSASSEEGVDQIVDRLKNDLEREVITMSTCGVLMIVKTLCIDVMRDGKIFKRINLSRS
ncbi:MAG: hypothetical protein LR008_00615 [Candidatus Pacebacteria bacterium]|nr:hypothetical protein [Candidatus Paceibacterota bacterium]